MFSGNPYTNKTGFSSWTEALLSVISLITRQWTNIHAHDSNLAKTSGCLPSSNKAKDSMLAVVSCPATKKVTKLSIATSMASSLSSWDSGIIRKGHLLNGPYCHFEMFHFKYTSMVKSGDISVVNYVVFVGSYSFHMSTLVQVLTWHRQAISHFLQESWPRSLARFGVINSSPPGQNGHHFADDIFICIFMNENFCS